MSFLTRKKEFSDTVKKDGEAPLLFMLKILILVLCDGYWYFWGTKKGPEKLRTPVFAWRAICDSNARPLASEANTLSSWANRPDSQG